MAKIIPSPLYSADQEHDACGVGFIAKLTGERSYDVVNRALTALNKRFESWDIDAWHYGQMHTLTFKHPFEKNETLRSMVNIGPFEIGGANTTLNNGEWDFNEPFSVRVGPSMRQIVDFADTSAFLRSVITSGASGQPLNPYYSNQTVLWMSNGYLTLTSTSPRGTAATSVTRLSAK